jgi:propionyl-CoA carboxylase beta chain
MNSTQIGADLNLAWPNAEIAVMGAAGACNIIFRGEIGAAKDPEAKRKEVISEYSDKFANPYIAAQKGYIDAVILPEETRDYLIKGLAASSTKREDGPKRKHGNIPL